MAPKTTTKIVEPIKTAPEPTTPAPAVSLAPVQVNIGKADTKITVDPSRFSQAVLDHVFFYGLNKVLNDANNPIILTGPKATPGAPSKALALSQKKLDALYAGTVRMVSERTGRIGDPAKANAIVWLMQAIRGLSEFKKLEDKAVREKAKEWFDANPTKYRAEAEARIAEQKAFAEAMGMAYETKGDKGDDEGENE